jgi:hypothetical protein
LKSIRKIRSPTDNKIRAALKLLPRGLPETYQKVIEAINQQETDERELALEIFQWIACAQRRLTVLELVHATAIKHWTTTIDDDDIPAVPEKILEVCGNLVRIDGMTYNSRDEGRGPFVEFIHLSVKEFLMQANEVSPKSIPRVLPATKRIHINIATTCLRYLSLQPLSSASRLSAKDFPLVSYAALYWDQHIRLSQTKSMSQSRSHRKLGRILRDFLNSGHLMQVVKAIVEASVAETVLLFPVVTQPLSEGRLRSPSKLNYGQQLGRLETLTRIKENIEWLLETERGTSTFHVD